MKTIMKRALSYILLVCMLLTILPLGVFAEEAPADANAITFDFTGLVTEGTMDPGKYNETDVGRNWRASLASRGTVLCHPEYTEYVPKTSPDWDLTGADMAYEYKLMFTLYDVASAIYTMDLNMIPQDAASSFKMEVYIQNASDRPSINSSGTAGYMAKNEPIATINGGDATSTIKNVSLVGDANNSYYIMFRILHNDGTLDNTSVKLKSIVLTKSQQKPVTQPTTPDFNTPTEPADNADDGSSFPVVPVVIAAVAVIAVAAVVVVVIGKKKNKGAE